MKDLAISHLGYAADILDDIYLNAGLMVGRASDLLRVISMANMETSEDDQAIFTDLMYNNPELIVLDYGQALFGNNRNNAYGDEACIFQMIGDESNQRLVHAKTQTSPLFVHSPGGHLQCHDDLAALLGIEAVSRQARRRLGEVWYNSKRNYGYRDEGTQNKVK
jgi:hypothetical protein